MRHADMDSSASASQASQVVSPAVRADISDTTKPLYLRPLGDGASTASCGCVRCSSGGASMSTQSSSARHSICRLRGGISRCVRCSNVWGVFEIYSSAVFESAESEF